MQSKQASILILVAAALCAQLAGASYLLTHTNSRTMGTFTPDMCVAPELELQRMEPKNLTQYIRTPLESVRTRLMEDTKASQGSPPAGGLAEEPTGGRAANPFT